MQKFIIRFTAALSLSAVTAFSASDGVYPLTDNSWDNPEFRKRFLGSYGFNLEINPKITQEESEMLSGVAELMNTQPEQAINSLQSSITPESSAAIDYTIGSLYLQMGDTQKAITQYRVAIEKFPNFYRAYQNIGYALVQEGNYAEAKPMLIEAIEIGGGNGTLYGLLGYCFLNLGESSLSLDAYRQALLFQPESADWLLGKLNSLLDMNMNEEAIGMLSDIIKRNPEKANYWMMQANAYMGASDIRKALANLELLSRMNGASSASLALLGDIFLNEGLPALAVERYGDAIAKGGLPASKLLAAAEGLTQRGSFNEALELVEKIEADYVSELSPAEALGLLNIKASGAIAQGEMDRAAEILEMIVSKDPMNGKALILLGDYHKGQGDTERAMIHYERATKSNGFEAKALIELARLEVSLGNYKSALTHLKRANTLEPKSYLQDYIERLEAATRTQA